MNMLGQPFVALLIIATSLCGVPTRGAAQKIGSSAANHPSVQVKRVAILPLMFRDGDKETDNPEATGAYRTALFAAFEKLGMERIDEGKVNGVWRELTGSSFDSGSTSLPEPEKLVQLGRRLAVDYVVVSRCQWKIRSPWVGLGPKTKAIATVDLWIVDVSKSEFSLKAKEESDSTKREEAYETAIALLVAPITIVSGGPKSPHMKRSGVMALTKAIVPWLKKQSPDKIKIDGKK